MISMMFQSHCWKDSTQRIYSDTTIEMTWFSNVTLFTPIIYSCDWFVQHREILRSPLFWKRGSLAPQAPNSRLGDPKWLFYVLVLHTNWDYGIKISTERVCWNTLHSWGQPDGVYDSEISGGKEIDWFR